MNQTTSAWSINEKALDGFCFILYISWNTHKHLFFVVISARVCKMHRSMHLYTCASITESHLITMCTCSRWKRRQWRSSARMTVVRCSPFYVFQQAECHCNILQRQSNKWSSHCNSHCSSFSSVAGICKIEWKAVLHCHWASWSRCQTWRRRAEPKPGPQTSISRDLLIPPGWDCPWCLRQSCKPASQSGPGHVRTQSKR